MRTLQLLLPGLLAVFMVTGCASSRSVQPGETRNIFKEYEVRSQAKWARVGFRNVEVWTVDGPQLQQLRFYRELETGDSLFEIPIESVLIAPSVLEKQPKYHEEMLPHDVVEMVTATLMQWGAVDAVARGPRPEKFGGRDGFRFDVQFHTGGGVQYRALALGHITRENRLLLILYMGAEDVYYPKFLAEVENIIASVRWL